MTKTILPDLCDQFHVIALCKHLIFWSCADYPQDVFEGKRGALLRKGATILENSHTDLVPEYIQRAVKFKSDKTCSKCGVVLIRLAREFDYKIIIPQLFHTMLGVFLEKPESVTKSYLLSRRYGLDIQKARRVYIDTLYSLDSGTVFTVAKYLLTLLFETKLLPHALAALTEPVINEGINHTDGPLHERFPRIWLEERTMAHWLLHDCPINIVRHVPPHTLEPMIIEANSAERIVFSYGDGTQMTFWAGGGSDGLSCEPPTYPRQIRDSILRDIMNTINLARETCPPSINSADNLIWWSGA